MIDVVIRIEFRIEVTIIFRSNITKHHNFFVPSSCQRTKTPMTCNDKRRTKGLRRAR